MPEIESYVSIPGGGLTKGFVKSHLDKVAEKFIDQYESDSSKFEPQLQNFKYDEIIEMYPVKNENLQDSFYHAVIQNIEDKIFWKAVHSNIQYWSSYEFSNFKLTGKAPEVTKKD